MGRDKPGVDGYWKGQMIGELLVDQGSTPNNGANRAPRRILLKLEESAGIVEGRFAQSSDVIAFRQIASEGSRHVSTYAVTGTLEGTRVRLSFEAETGRTFEIDGLVNEGVITGSYVERYPTGPSQATGTGQFEVERL